jgi:FMN phosphatase YigB (HAD superfamily)
MRHPLPIIAVDSDGTVLDAMTPKHRHAFAPALIDVWQIKQNTDATASELFLNINLRSRHRGANRFEALGLFLREWQKNPSAELPSLAAYFAWLDSGAARSESSLETALAAHPGDIAVARALAWSREVNRRCATLPPPVPFAGAAAALCEAEARAQVVVVSGGNGKAIRSEWQHAGLAHFAGDFLTQEAGAKTAILKQLAARAGSPQRVLMLGDSLLDDEAAIAAGCPFFPIIPGVEHDSWDAFRLDALPAFIAGEWPPPAAARWLEDFHSTLGA